MPIRRYVLATLIVVLALVAVPLTKRLRAVRLLEDLSAPANAGASAPALTEREVWLPGPQGYIRSRLYYLPDVGAQPGLVVAHGVHYRGIDERRLVPFARALARSGHVVLTPELSELADYRITRQGVEVITTAVTWLSQQAALVSTPRVGLLGFSFAGGLGLVAAEQPDLAGKLDFVTSIGGHHDLRRVLSFLLSDETATPHGVQKMKAHEYGLVVLLYGEVDAFVEEPDREVMRDALRFWLHEDRPAAIARASERTTESGERLYLLLAQGKLGVLAPKLRERLEARSSELRELSPSGRLHEIGVPVYLLHGSGDTVIPPSETEWAGLELHDAPHQALVSPLLEHVEVSGHAGLVDQLELVDFMSRLL